MVFVKISTNQTEQLQKNQTLQPRISRCFRSQVPTMASHTSDEQRRSRGRRDNGTRKLQVVPFRDQDMRRTSDSSLDPRSILKIVI